MILKTKQLTIIALLFCNISTSSNEIQQNNYQPSGCVEISFNTNKEGKATNLEFTKEHPKGVFLEQAFNNITNMTFPTVKNKKRKSVFLRFQSDNSWPLPFECLERNSNIKNIADNKFLEKAEYSEIKKAFDQRFFQTLYDSIKTQTSSPVVVKNNNNTFDISVKTTWTTDANNADFIAKHYFDLKYASSKDGEIKAFEIQRNQIKKNQNQTDANNILNYIGQRTIKLITKLNDIEKTIIIGAPINGTSFCKGNISKRESFDKYCLTHSNSKGITTVFKNVKQKDLNDISISTEFRINNSYLIRLPKTTELME